VMEQVIYEEDIRICSLLKWGIRLEKQ